MGLKATREREGVWRAENGLGLKSTHERKGVGRSGHRLGLEAAYKGERIWRSGHRLGLEAAHEGERVWRSGHRLGLKATHEGVAADETGKPGVQLLHRHHDRPAELGRTVLGRYLLLRGGNTTVRLIGIKLLLSKRNSTNTHGRSLPQTRLNLMNLG